MDRLDYLILAIALATCVAVTGAAYNTLMELFGGVT